MAKRENVTSREYKVMLRARLFDGDEQQMHSAIDSFWADLTAALAGMDIPCEGSFAQVKARRLIRFFDTDEHRINADQYIVREREDLDTGEREVTLKFRHPDRYVAADRRMDPADARDAKTKFEEDVKPPFVSVYSFSTTQPLQSGSVLGQVQDELDRPANALGILGHEQHAMALRHPLGHLAPEGHGGLAGDREHEAHRRPALDAVDEHIGQLVDVTLVHAIQSRQGPPG